MSFVLLLSSSLHEESQVSRFAYVHCCNGKRAWLSYFACSLVFKFVFILFVNEYKILVTDSAVWNISWVRCEALGTCTVVVASALTAFVTEVRVSTITGEPVGLELSYRPRTVCPRANTFSLMDRSSIQFCVSIYSFRLLYSNSTI